jgi:hypothetical protein
MRSGSTLLVGSRPGRDWDWVCELSTLYSCGIACCCWVGVEEQSGRAPGLIAEAAIAPARMGGQVRRVADVDWDNPHLHLCWRSNTPQLPQCEASIQPQQSSVLKANERTNTTLLLSRGPPVAANMQGQQMGCNSPCVQQRLPSSARSRVVLAHRSRSTRLHAVAKLATTRRSGKAVAQVWSPANALTLPGHSITPGPIYMCSGSHTLPVILTDAIDCASHRCKTQSSRCCRRWRAPRAGARAALILSSCWSSMQQLNCWSRMGACQVGVSCGNSAVRGCNSVGRGSEGVSCLKAAANGCKWGGASVEMQGGGCFVCILQNRHALSATDSTA